MPAPNDKPQRKIGVYDRPASADRSLARKLLPVIVILLLVALLLWFLLR